MTSGMLSDHEQSEVGIGVSKEAIGINEMGTKKRKRATYPAFFTEYQGCSSANQALANMSKIMDFLAILVKNFKTPAETTKRAE